MGILYAMVARGHVVLAEFSAAAASNAGVVARQILEKQLPQGNADSNASYSQDRYVFHVKRTDGLVVLCMADDASERRIPFAFLEDIHQRFVKTYSRAILSAPPYAMNDEFSRILSQEMERYSNDPNADRLNRLKGEMSQVRTVMINNIEKVLDRGDRLALLVEKTSTLQGNTLRFRKQSRRFKNTVWWGNVKLTGALLLVFAIILYVVLAFLCGGLFMPSCLSLAFGVD
ncbi:vesicle-associated membrane protein 713-like [Syzygium oleosum]|uniref:vesicle-associated membrane protein 713-like n=1 Tax=Syzygium oleosum TaxID=219896 RepID=UPI0011D29DC3|nr:vesicle-associated membrane protein 713-like [Syzygium oleosum]